jgi:hypothetical protein
MPIPDIAPSLHLEWDRVTLQRLVIRKPKDSGIATAGRFTV